jgi:hypothetical protein
MPLNCGEEAFDRGLEICNGPEQTRFSRRGGQLGEEARS